MHLAHLRLRDFRNYARLDADFGPGFHLLLGDNAQGKTNLLEAIYLMATLRTFRGVGSAQMVPVRVPAIRTRVVNPYGAGDAVTAALAAGMLDGPPNLAALLDGAAWAAASNSEIECPVVDPTRDPHPGAFVEPHSTAFVRSIDTERRLTGVFAGEHSTVLALKSEPSTYRARLQPRRSHSKCSSKRPRLISMSGIGTKRTCKSR